MKSLKEYASKQKCLESIDENQLHICYLISISDAKTLDTQCISLSHYTQMVQPLTNILSFFQIKVKSIQQTILMSGILGF